MLLFLVGLTVLQRRRSVGILDAAFILNMFIETSRYTTHAVQKFIHSEMGAKPAAEAGTKAAAGAHLHSHRPVYSV
jgi:hypothetical protein